MNIHYKNGSVALLVVLVLVLIFSVTACGRTKTDDTTFPIVDATEPTVTGSIVTEPAETKPSETEPPETDPLVTESTSPETTGAEPSETEPPETEPLCEHKFYPNAKTVIPTCQTEGYTEYTCKLCNEKVRDNFKPVVDHLYVKKVISYASCTTDGLEATVCTYCGEKKPAEHVCVFNELDVFDDDYVFGKCGDCGAERMLFTDYWLKAEASTDFEIGNDTRYSFPSDFTKENRENPYQLEFTLTFNGYTNVSSANKVNIVRYNNYNNSILLQYVVDEETAEIKSNDENQTHIVELIRGESAKIKFWVDPKNKTISIYVNDTYILSRYDENFQFENEASLRWGYGGSFSYTVSDLSIIRPVITPQTEEGLIPAYGHSTVYKILDVPSLTHHKIEVGECKSCGEIFEAKGVKGEEHKFVLVESVADDETPAGIKIYGYEVFKCDCGYVLTVSSNHKDGHFYEVDVYTGLYKCRCGSIIVEDFNSAYNGNENAGVIGRRENADE